MAKESSTGSPPSLDGARQLADLLTATPGLRAKLFANPTKEVGRQLPPKKYWNYGTKWWRWRARRRARVSLASNILLHIAEDVSSKKLASTVNTDAVFEEFFAPIVKVSQRSFNSVFLLSWGAFVAGLGLIGAGV